MNTDLLTIGIAGLIGASGNLIIADGGKSEYRIVISHEASFSEKHAADELQKFLNQISGATLPIVTDETPISGNEIILGDNAHLRQLKTEIDFEKLGKEGFTIRTVGPHLVIAGGKLRGTMYGVYTFLEEHLGCRWFSSKVSHIPKRNRIEIGPIDDTQIPILEYREPFYTDAFDADWAARNKMNSNTARLDEQRGGKVAYSHFVHTFYPLLPPEQYFAEHPEYYSEIDGKRIVERGQLCLTNPDVVQLVTEQVKQWIRESPQATIFSVSQNDWHGWCQCKSCREIDEREESHSGTMLHFVNQIAEGIESEYPDVAIDTLAYQYTRKPPKYVRPRPNVIVRLCSIECCFSHPLETCEMNASFKADIEGWSKVSNRLYIWDYVTNFSHYIQPFPNFDVLKPNIQFFVNHGVKGIFEEGNYSGGGGGELAELRAYVMAKVLWNPDYDAQKAMNEFLVGYYGKAFAPIREYIDMLHNKVREDNIHMTIRARPDSAFLAPEIIQRANELFDEAERLADDDDVLHRVYVARLPIQYVQISTLPKDDSKRQKLIDRFFKVSDKAGITNISEGRSMQQYREMIKGK
ncbi:DUF4838 domain-containing protein [Candidatus Poribacteria bacterium]|nr:DUF4838 domain-containing protein [Candidatus Poribacteria bacterium]